MSDPYSLSQKWGGGGGGGGALELFQKKKIHRLNIYLKNESTDSRDYCFLGHPKQNV